MTGFTFITVNYKDSNDVMTFAWTTKTWEDEKILVDKMVDDYFGILDFTTMKVITEYVKVA